MKHVSLSRLSSKTLSARVISTPSQKLFYGTLALLWLASALLFGLQAVRATVLVISVFYFFVVGFKMTIFLKGLFLKKRRLRYLSSRELPTYTVLVPVYRESKATLENLVSSLKKLRYCKSKLSVMLVTNSDDSETNEVISSMRLPSNFKHLKTKKPYEPRGKPLSLNRALKYVDSDLMVVYDAEDMPEPDQLLKAAATFASLPEDVVCLQSKLNYYNHSENILAMMFTVEYSTWFDYFISGLTGFNLPVPLGGTSNHFKVKFLKKLGCYDAYNVTEDCDMGMRIARAGWRVAALSSTTLEEACISLPAWIKQRTRWVKGYAVTWLVHTRDLRQLVRDLGFKGTITFVLFVLGVPIVNLVNPVLYVFSVTWLLFKPDWVSFIFSGIESMSLALFLLGNSALILMGVIAAWRRKLYMHCFIAFLMPLYYLLQSISTYRAMRQLLSDPHAWEKTPHGLTSVSFPSSKRR